MKKERERKRDEERGEMEGREREREILRRSAAWTDWFDPQVC